MRDQTETEKARKLLEYCRANGRVCPKPWKWHELWLLLPNRRPVGLTWQPLPPLILAGWDFSSDWEKAERLAYHITWAEQHGQLDKVDRFLRGLEEREWYHGEKAPW